MCGVPRASRLFSCFEKTENFSQSLKYTGNGRGEKVTKHMTERSEKCVRNYRNRKGGGA